MKAAPINRMESPPPPPVCQLLVVEDDAALRNLILRTLHKAGHQAVGAGTGEEALQLLETPGAWILLLDYQLPDMSGSELVTRLTARSQVIPFIAMTGQGSERLAVEIMKLGAADYLLKDTDFIDHLPGVVDRLVRTLETEHRLRLAEQALEQTGQRFRMLFQKVPSVSVQGYSNEGVIHYWNEASAKLYGYTAEEAIGRNVVDLLVPPEWREEARAELRELCEQPHERSGREVELMRKDGTRVEVIATHVFMQLAGWAPELFRIDVDLTEQKTAQRNLEKALERNEALLNANPDLMFLFDAEARVVDFHCRNPASNLYVNPREFLGKTCDGFLPAELAEQTRLNVMSVLKTGRPSYYTYRLGRMTLKYYESRYVRCGRDHVLAFVRDITEQRMAESERERLQIQLNQAQKMESVGRLAGGVAHDFNNMLGVIMGFSEMLLESMDPNHPHYIPLTEIRKATERSAALTRQLLTFARKQSVQLRPLDLNATIDGALGMLRRLIGDNVELKWRPSSQPCGVLADPTQVHQILVNLCVNARDAIRGHGVVDIETNVVELVEEDGLTPMGCAPGMYAQVIVRDNGVGMDADMLEHLFEPFYTTKGVGEGTGLGLATVYGIVQQNNGCIQVESQAGQGSVFQVCLPASQIPVSSHAETLPAGGGRAAHETVLLVEDDPALLRMTRLMLEREGYTVLASLEPAEALALSLEHPAPIHLLLTDVIMPDLGGRELSERVREVRTEIKTLFMSGHAMDELIQRGILAPDADFLHKPFNKQELTRRVNRVLES